MYICICFVELCLEGDLVSITVTSEIMVSVRRVITIPFQIKTGTLVIWAGHAYILSKVPLEELLL